MGSEYNKLDCLDVNAYTMNNQLLGLKQLLEAKNHMLKIPKYGYKFNRVDPKRVIYNKMNWHIILDSM